VGILHRENRLAIAFERRPFQSQALWQFSVWVPLLAWSKEKDASHRFEFANRHVSIKPKHSHQQQGEKYV